MKPPRCFTPDEWKLWRTVGARWAHLDVRPCDDCTAEHQGKMRARGLCEKAEDFTPAYDPAPPSQTWVEVRFVH